MIQNKINGVPDELTEQLVELILSHKPAKKIVLYGSRATDDYRKTSDIDIAIVDESWDRSDIALVHSNMEENLSTPLKFDLTCYYSLSKESMKRAVEQGVVLYESK